MARKAKRERQTYLHHGTRSSLLGTGSYRVECTPFEDVTVEMILPGSSETTLYIFKAEDAYEFAQAILRGYDMAAGITPPPMPDA